MYGSKGRIGLLVPSSNGVMENELHIMAPKEVGILTSRMGRRDFEKDPSFNDVDILKKMTDDLENAAEGFSDARLNVVVYGCTSGSFIDGLEGEADIIQRLKRILPDVPAVTTMKAVLDALKESEIDKLAIGTPYTDYVNERLQKLLEGVGFKIVSIKGYGGIDMEAQYPEFSYNLAKEIYNDEADGILLSCTQIRTIENIEPLERELGKPVITSNQASLWAALKAIGYTEPIYGYGKLLRNI